MFTCLFDTSIWWRRHLVTKCRWRLRWWRIIGSNQSATNHQIRLIIKWPRWNTGGFPKSVQRHSWIRVKSQEWLNHETKHNKSMWILTWHQVGWRTTERTISRQILFACTFYVWKTKTRSNWWRVTQWLIKSYSIRTHPFHVNEFIYPFPKRWMKNRIRKGLQLMKRLIECGRRRLNFIMFATRGVASRGWDGHGPDPSNLI
mgnify:CR=1 FL=1